LARAKRHYIPGQAAKNFVDRIKAALGRRTHKVSGGYELREPERSYNVDFDPKKSGIGLKNTYNWASFP
jgi:hypothetical protein